MRTVIGALAGLVVAADTPWLAGNQFFAMDDAAQAFQKQNPGLDVGLNTLPPALNLDAIKARGWTCNGVEQRVHRRASPRDAGPHHAT